MVLLSATENKPSGQESHGQVNRGADNEPHAFQTRFRRRKRKTSLQLLNLYYQNLSSHQPDLHTATISFIKSTEGNETLWGSTNDSELSSNNFNFFLQEKSAGHLKKQFIEPTIFHDFA